MQFKAVAVGRNARNKMVGLTTPMEKKIFITSWMSHANVLLFSSRFFSLSGGFKEMSSILPDQQRPSNMSANSGGGGVSGSQPMRTAMHITWHGAQINFGDQHHIYYMFSVLSVVPATSYWGGIFKRLWSPGIDSTEWIVASTGSFKRLSYDFWQKA